MGLVVPLSGWVVVPRHARLYARWIARLGGRAVTGDHVGRVCDASGVDRPTSRFDYADFDRVKREVRPLGQLRDSYIVAADSSPSATT